MLGEGGGRGWPCRDKAESSVPPWASGRARSPGAAASEHTWGDKRRGGHNMTGETWCWERVAASWDGGKRKVLGGKPRHCTAELHPSSAREGGDGHGKQGGRCPQPRQVPLRGVQGVGESRQGSAAGGTEEVKAGAKASTRHKAPSNVRAPLLARRSPPQPPKSEAAVRAPATTSAWMRRRQREGNSSAHVPQMLGTELPILQSPTKGLSFSNQANLGRPPAPGLLPATLQPWRSREAGQD